MQSKLENLKLWKDISYDTIKISSTWKTSNEYTSYKKLQNDI